MPFTFISSCVERKGVFCLYSMTRAASLGPTPGSVVSCSTVAVLMLTLAVGAGLPAAIAGPDASRAAIARASPAAKKRRSVMFNLLHENRRDRMEPPHGGR